MRLTFRPSPITTESVALAGKGYSNLRAFGGILWFLTRDPARAGKSSVQSLSSTGAIVVRQETPPLAEYNVRSAVHEYGGGAMCVGPNGDGVIFTDFPSHAVWWAKAEEETIVPVVQRDGCRFADFSVCPKEPSRLIALMEDHTDPAPPQVKNSIVSIAMDGSGDLVCLASGHDFYASPKLNKDGTKLAYVGWDHPNMPWDDASLYIQTLDEHGTPLGSAVPIQDGHDEPDVSVTEPCWSRDDVLYFLSDKEGWYNLYQWNGSSSVNLCPMSVDFSSPSQGWILGQSPYTFLQDGTLVASYTPSDVKDGDEEGAKLVLIPRTAGSTKPAPKFFGRSCIPPTAISSLCATQSGGLYFVGGSTKEPAAIWFWARPGDETCVAEKVLTSIDPALVDLAPLQSAMSTPRLVQFPSVVKGGVGHAYGYFYPPTNLSSDLPDDFKPPLLVKAHGGPTSRTSCTFRLDIQFWTSRGFAVLDVDYGGSTGYGKKFRESLKGNWGVLDVADVCNGARWCVDQGLANGEWLCIDGRSAGGYTVLASLVFQNTFSAGASLYGISDLGALARDTHKFESRYMDGLIGKYPEEKAIYDERCPINYTNKLNCPVILLQGDEDKVVPPDQAETMFMTLKAKDLPTALVLYKGEQHGFRKSENIRHALNSEYDFFCSIFGFEAQREDGLSGVEIGERVVI